MHTHTITGVSAAASVTGLKSNATGASTTLTATNCGDSLAHLITIKGDAATDHSLKTAIITGTDANGAAQTETVNLPNGTATVTSTKYFLTVTTVTWSATIGADTMDIGWALGSVSPPVHMDPVSPPEMGIACTIAGSPTYSVEQTLNGTDWYAHATIATKSAAFDGSLLYPVKALRLKWTAAGTVTMTALQR
jgi:hypothetical protein